MFRIERYGLFLSMMVIGALLLATLPPQASGVADLEEPYWTVAQDIIGPGYVQMSEDGKILVAVDNDLLLNVYDLDTKEKLWDFSPAAGLSFYNPFVLSDDGSVVVVADAQGTLFYMDISRGNEPLWTYNTTSYVEMAINGNGTLLYVVTVGNIVSFGDEGLIESYGPDSSITGGAKVVMATDTAKAIVYDDLHAWSKSSPSEDWYAWDMSVSIEKVMMAKDGSSTMFVYGDGKVSVSKSTSSGGMNWALELPFNVFSNNIEMSRDGSTIAVQKETGQDVTFFVIDVASEMIVWEKTFGGSGYFTLSGDGRLIMYSYYWSETTRAIDKWTGEPTQESEFASGNLCLVSTDGSTVVLTDQVTLNVFKETVQVEEGQDDDDGTLQMLVLIGLGIGIAILILLVVLLLKKK